MRFRVPSGLLNANCYPNSTCNTGNTPALGFEKKYPKNNTMKIHVSLSREHRFIVSLWGIRSSVRIVSVEKHSSRCVYVACIELLLHPFDFRQRKLPLAILLL